MTLLPVGMNKDILKMEKLAPGTVCPVMVATLPKEIRKEMDLWIKECKKVKDSPLAELKAHENVGYIDLDGKKHNSYQTSVLPRLVEESFWLAWTLRLAEKYWPVQKPLGSRPYRIRKHDSQFVVYDIWTNFAYKGDYNPTHNHAGIISGVIYYKNHLHPTLFDEYDLGCNGIDGTMVMFPSTVLHHVPEQIRYKERITLAFNLELSGDHKPYWA